MEKIINWNVEIIKLANKVLVLGEEGFESKVHSYREWYKSLSLVEKENHKDFLLRDSTAIALLPLISKYWLQSLDKNVDTFGEDWEEEIKSLNTIRLVHRDSRPVRLIISSVMLDYLLSLNLEELHKLQVVSPLIESYIFPCDLNANHLSEYLKFKTIVSTTKVEKLKTGIINRLMYVEEDSDLSKLVEGILEKELSIVVPLIKYDFMVPRFKDYVLNYSTHLETVEDYNTALISMCDLLSGNHPRKGDL